MIDIKDGLHDNVRIDNFINNRPIFINTDTNRKQEAHIEYFLLQGIISIVMVNNSLFLKRPNICPHTNRDDSFYISCIESYRVDHET